MRNEPKITHIRIHFQGTAKGKRKIDFQSEAVDIIPDHVMLIPDQFNDYERKVWQILDDKAYKNVSRCEIVVNYGWDAGPNITSMEMLPRQRQLILRTV